MKHSAHRRRAVVGDQLALTGDGRTDSDDVSATSWQSEELSSSQGISRKACWLLPRSTPIPAISPQSLIPCANWRVRDAPGAIGVP